MLPSFETSELALANSLCPEVGEVYDARSEVKIRKIPARSTRHALISSVCKSHGVTGRDKLIETVGKAPDENPFTVAKKRDECTRLLFSR